MTTTQPALFDLTPQSHATSIYNTPLPPYNGTETSKAAAVAIAPVMAVGADTGLALSPSASISNSRDDRLVTRRPETNTGGWQ